MIQVKVKKMFDDVTLPEYATPGSACFDIKSYGVEDANQLTALHKTGLQFEVPDNHVMLVFSRSGHGFKDNVRLANCVGVIDSDYRGELKVKHTLDVGTYHEKPAVRYGKGDKIAQGMVIPYEQVKFFISDELSTTERGEGGFGSTGV